MKKLIYIYPLLVLLFLSGCNDILEETPKSFLTSENYYQTEVDAFGALMGVYSIAAQDNLYGSYLSTQSSLGSDEGYYSKNKGGSHYFTNYVITDATGNLDGTWKKGFSGINACNMFLKHIPKSSQIDEQRKERYLNEVKFLRGVFYFELTRLFGELPIVTDVKSVKELQIGRSSVTDVYAQIVADMEAGLELPWISEMAGSDHPRVSKNAALAFLTRVYITMAGKPLEDTEKYELAASTAKRLIDEGGHALHDNYNKVWLNIRDDKYDLTESIWEIAFTGGTSGNAIGTWNGILSSNGANGENGKDVGGGYGYAKCTVALREKYGAAGNTYEADLPDTRYHWNCIPYKLDGKGNPVMKNGKIVEQKEWSLCKFRKNANNGAYHYNQNGINWEVARYADVLLMYAEAENELNGAGRNAYANEAVKLIRQRAYRQFDEGGSFTQLDDQPIEGIDYAYDYSAMDQETFRQFVRDERAREMAGEGIRKADLIRWGILYETVSALDGVEPKGYCWANIQPHHVLYPIARAEIDLNPHLLPNNNGY